MSRAKSALDNAAASGWFFFAAGGESRLDEINLNPNNAPTVK